MANQIHPTCIIEGDVKLGDNNVLHPYTVLLGPLEIGDNNIIGPHVVIGSPGQDTKNPRYDSSQKRVIIGSHNIIREFTAIQKPCFSEATRVGSHIYFMQSVHIPHDAIIEDNVVMTPMVVLAGMVKLLNGTNIGMGATIHQHTVVGQYSMVAHGAAVSKNVKPFSKYIPNRPIAVNSYAVQKFQFGEFAKEIEDYVLRDIAPVSDRVKRVIDHYQALHLKSERKQY